MQIDKKCCFISPKIEVTNQQPTLTRTTSRTSKKYFSDRLKTCQVGHVFFNSIQRVNVNSKQHFKIALCVIGGTDLKKNKPKRRG